MAQETYFFKNEKSIFKNLSLEEIEKISEIYLTSKRIADIGKEYPLLGKVDIKKNLPFKLSDEKCEVCSNAVYHKPAKLKLEKFCPSCKHDYTTQCQCLRCKAKRIVEKKIDYDKSLWIWKEKVEPIFSERQNYSDLDLPDRITLALLLKNFCNPVTGEITFPLKYGLVDTYGENFNEDLANTVTDFILKNIFKPIANPNIFRNLPSYMLLSEVVNYPCNFSWELNLN